MSNSTTMTAKRSREQHLLEQFLGHSSDYYVEQFERLSHNRRAISFNVAALVAGPLWAASRNLWGLFWLAAALDVFSLVFVAQGLWGAEEYGQRAALGVVLFGLFRGLIAVLSNPFYHRYFNRWRIDTSLSCGVSQQRSIQGLILMLATYPLTIYRFSAQEVAGFIETFPTSRAIARTTAHWIDSTVEWLTLTFEGLFDTITLMIREILNFLELVFIGVPWPVMALLLILLAWRMAGMKVVLFTAAALSYLGFFGFWDKAMSTMALVAASVFICFIVGTPLGIWAAKNHRVNAVLTPLLDLMQTMPSFVYLIPAIAFFSVGKPPAVLATVIFAMPPMIRLTTLGIRQVPESVIEAMLAFGASPRQILFKAELPLAVPSIMAGINQSIMMSLSMVVIAALIGAGGLGYDVLFSLQHMEAGKGLLAGIAIVLCAMILDRIIQGGRKQ